MGGRRTLAAAVIVGGALLLGILFLVRDDPAQPAEAANQSTLPPSTEIAKVVRQDLTESTKIIANVGFGAVNPLPISAEGIVTWAPERGSVLGDGDIAVKINNRPVTLTLGQEPLYRELRLVPAWERDEANQLVGQMTGLDVGQLQRFLMEQGFNDKGRLVGDFTFGQGTERAVKEWQKSVGHPITGRVDSSQLLFIQTTLRVDNIVVVGQTFTELLVTSSETILTATANTSSRPYFPVGSSREIPTSGTPVTGTVTSSRRSATQDGGPEQVIEITVTDAAAEDLDEAITLTGSVVRHEDALTVPVRALLALTEGGWAVEIPTDTGTTLRSVELIGVVDTTAVISGLDEGAEVVIPL